MTKNRNLILEKLISGEMIAPNVAEALRRNPHFNDLLIYFINKDKAYCLYNGFRYEMNLGENPRVLERYKMNEDLFLKHAKNFSKYAYNARFYFEPEQESLMRIPKVLSDYLTPMEWIRSITVLSMIELSNLLVTIGEMLLEEIKQHKLKDKYQKNTISGEKNFEDSSWVEIIKSTLQACRSLVQGEGITARELYNLLDSEDGSDIVELTLRIENPEILTFIHHVIEITAYVLTLAFYLEDGEGCPLPQILDSFQGEDMSDIFVTYILNLAQDKLICKEKLDKLIKNY